MAAASRSVVGKPALLFKVRCSPPVAVWPPVVAASRPTARQRASDGTRPRPVSPRPPLVGSGVAVGHDLNLPRLTPGLGGARRKS